MLSQHRVFFIEGPVCLVPYVRADLCPGGRQEGVAVVFVRVPDVRHDHKLVVCVFFVCRKRLVGGGIAGLG